jgi:hypothetical protein
MKKQLSRLQRHKRMPYLGHPCSSRCQTAACQSLPTELQRHISTNQFSAMIIIIMV